MRAYQTAFTKYFQELIAEWGEMPLQHVLKASDSGVYVICNDDIDKSILATAESIISVARYDLDFISTPAVYFYRPESLREAYQRLFKGDYTSRIYAKKKASGFVQRGHAEIYINAELNKDIREMMDTILHECYHIKHSEEYPQLSKDDDFRSQFENVARVYGSQRGKGGMSNVNKI